MSNPTSETIVAERDIRGHVFIVTRLTWRDTDDLSFDVSEKNTGTPLHDESFDDEPSGSDIEDLLDQISADLRDDTLEPFLDGYQDELAAIVGIAA